MPITKFEAFLQRICEVTSITSQASLANHLGVSRSAITQAKRNDSIPKKWISVLSQEFDLNPVWLEKGSGPQTLSRIGDKGNQFQKIRKVKARLSAGGGSFEVGSEIEGLYSFRSDWLSKKGNPENMVLMDIFGNSMEPELKDGDTVLIDMAQKAILAGAIYAVGLDDTIIVKRLEKRPDKLVLFSDNRDYDPIYLRCQENSNVRVIGKVIWVCREFN